MECLALADTDDDDLGLAGLCFTIEAMDVNGIDLDDRDNEDERREESGLALREDSWREECL